ncbi:MAG: PAS domain S-box protein [Leptospiraceae bacterium]|nr:PAS domain S-box protein [Leptospiraceae bacterium]MDW8307180.1 PAS domain S-box protein [Leptospiraceae bacterium]
MSEKKRLFYLVGTLIFTSLAIGVLTTYQQYTASINEKLNLVLFHVDSTKSLIEAVARFDRNTFRDKEKASHATLRQIEDAFLGESEVKSQHTILFARRHGQAAEIFMRYEAGVRNSIVIEPESRYVPLSIKYALERKRGAGIFHNLAGQEVLAAYDYIGLLDIALVIEMRLDVIRRPYIIRGLWTLTLAIVILMGAATLVIRLTEPLLAKLEEQQKLSQLIVQTAQDVLLILDEQEKIGTINPSGEKIFGYKLNEIFGKNIALLIPPEYEQNRSFYAFLRKNKGQRSFHAQVQGRRRGGKTIPLMLMGQKSTAHRKEYVVISLYDLTSLVHAHQKIMELSRRILDIQEQERQVISREIHDVLASNLVSLKLTVQSLLARVRKKGPSKEEKQEVLRQFDETIEMARKFSQILSPYGISHLDLAGALEKLVGSYQNLKTKMTFHFRSEVKSEILMDEASKLHAYRIVQEALQNAVKHSEANHIEVLLKEKARSVVVMVRDDGKGVEAKFAQEKGLGFFIMQERANLIGAKFHIRKRSQGGTEVGLVIPKKLQV